MNDFEFKPWKWFGMALVAILALTVLGVIASWLGFFGNVATKPAQVANRVISTDNILNSYNGFYKAHAAYESRVQCSSSRAPATANALPSPKVLEPIPVTLEWPRGWFRSDLSYHPEPEPNTPLGHTGRTGAKVTPYVGYQLWMILSDGKVEQEFDFPFCNENVPIIEADWKAPTQEDGCGGCEGPPQKLLGYRSRCGPRTYYNHEACTRDSLDVGSELLFGLQARGYYDTGERWHFYDRMRVECRKTKLDEYPVADIELRDVKALAEARKQP